MPKFVYHLSVDLNRPELQQPYHEMFFLYPKNEHVIGRMTSVEFPWISTMDIFFTQQTETSTIRTSPAPQDNPVE